jgi:hypothetical protein
MGFVRIGVWLLHFGGWYGVYIHVDKDGVVNVRKKRRGRKVSWES